MYINARKFGLAFGVTLMVFHAGCMLVIAVAGKEGAVLFFNSILHGLDVSSIIRTNMPFWEMAMGMTETFILGWLAGATIAVVYNFCLKGD